MDSMRFAFALAAIALLLAGCSTKSSVLGRGVDLANYGRIYVEKNLADDRGLNEMIVAELRALGYEASTGFPVTMPRGIQAVVTFRDEWTWDFKTYLIDIQITVKEPRSPRTLAQGRYFRPGITNKAPEAMVRDVVRSLFKPTKR